MHYNCLSALLLYLASTVAAKTITVEVGKSGLTYSPNNIKAEKGDSIEFQFESMHSVVASSFDKPCTPLSSGGFFSGFLPSGSKSSSSGSYESIAATSQATFTINVNSTDPVFFYCAVVGHCQAGMVGVINQGSDSLDSYKSAAAKTKSSVAPKDAFGGNSDSTTSDDGGAAGHVTASSTAITGLAVFIIALLAM